MKIFSVPFLTWIPKSTDWSAHHVYLSYLEKQKEENLRAKGRLLNLPNPPEKDEFVDKLIYLKKNMQDSCFPICP